MNKDKTKIQKEFKGPQGFFSYVTNVGIKNKDDDLVVVFSNTPCVASGVYTQSIFSGSAVKISKKNIKNNEAQALVVVSKNANVATGIKGYEDSKKIVETVSAELNLDLGLVQIASTGVIGKRYPIAKIISGLKNLPEKLSALNVASIANGIKTTDKYPKFYTEKIGEVSICAIAKGVGMIEPNMATLLVYFFTDAAIKKQDLNMIFQRVMNKTFNCISIDSDTSTSDSAVIFANGLAGEIALDSFESSLYNMSLNLIKDILRDGEGASKIIEVTVIQANSKKQAKLIGKSIINSPLVKTAIHGADPNWGRIIMAIGKCTSATEILAEKIEIKICNFAVFPQQLSDKNLKKLQTLMQQEQINIEVNLNIGKAETTVWGCDLSCDYVQFNSAYTT